RAFHQRQVTDDIENLVTDKFVSVAQRLRRENRVVADDDSVFQAAAFDQSALDQEFDLFKKAKCAGVRNIAVPGFRIDLDRKKLGKASVLIRARASDLELLIWENRNNRFTQFKFDWFFYRVDFAAFTLRLNPGRANHLHIFAGTAVGDRRLVRIEFHDRV